MKDKNESFQDYTVKNSVYFIFGKRMYRNQYLYLLLSRLNFKIYGNFA